MGFFGAVFAALTVYWQWHASGIALAVPFVVFAAIGVAAHQVIRLPGDGIRPSERAERTITWSSIAEGIGLFIASNIVINIHRPDLLLPAMALVVGLHFLPIAFAASFRPFYVLGTGLILGAIFGVLAGPPAGGAIAGFAAAGCLWIASAIAVRRDWRSKRAAMQASPEPCA
ncbi:hypothetical protein [Novosphingobium sp. JCM 18896]|uniref:hypothetical protein n=1 Tax=Novosphingobium sp. JCM 18896 TaxID=2989731 RepID=UPI00222362B9|nr:hypothetical protein [Novosphingobium sp. JCM 18896]MCW1429938.1 hypothetical protein [Novosphingobium sp. JCM 18896]